MKKLNGLYYAALVCLTLIGCAKEVNLKNHQIDIHWSDDEGWKVDKINVKVNEVWVPVGIARGEHTVLYSATKPDSQSVSFKTITNVVFPEPNYHYQIEHWRKSTASVALNTAGEAYHFYPEHMASDKALRFHHELPIASISSEWRLDSEYPSDVVVIQTLVAKQDGYFSMASPTLLTIQKDDVAWATVPGYFQGNTFQENFVLSYAYGQGIPKLPVIYPERCASTLAPIISTQGGTSVSITPEPGLARDPWTNNRLSQQEWRLGLSHMNRRAEVSPTLYYPVLGETASKLQKGDTLRFECRYSIMNGSWYENMKHVGNDIYKFHQSLGLRENERSLTQRIEAMHQYLTDSKTSLWNIETFNGMKIGGQSYLGGVVGAQGDAMKNADYGAMWMLARATDDPLLQNQVLPFALNFKLAQQQTSPGFFSGAAIGQYYLAKRKKFVEEWGEYVEPISLTYYTMLDMGNILLFEPQNKLLQKRLRLGADLLLSWQKDDGSWEVAYDHHTEKPRFTDIKDVRPTFYGLLVAYRILKDAKYLTAARRGADWLVENAVKRGHFIGVCGDARFAPDFATAQTAQALLDLYEITKEDVYKDAAIQTARFYTSSIYTHPIPSKQKKQVNGVERLDWEIAQAGLSFEHGGIMGSAQRHGPILLASHAGLFVRMFALTNDSLFIDMARAAAIGRDAFVDPQTSVATYYWNAMSKGAGPYPHHAWWQIGWITDYLLAEAALRSRGQVAFPRGFVTPKVGPHQSYGFEAGNIFSIPAKLVVRQGLVKTNNPNFETITALAVDGEYLLVIVMNDVGKEQKASLDIDVTKLPGGRRLKNVAELMAKTTLPSSHNITATLASYGIQVYRIGLE